MKTPKLGDKVWMPWVGNYKKGRIVGITDDYVLVKVRGGLGVWREPITSVIAR